MTHDELRTRIRTAVARYTRAIADDNGVPFSLIEELTGVAVQHATDENLAAADRALTARRKPRTTDQTTDR